MRHRSLKRTPLGLRFMASKTLANRAIPQDTTIDITFQVADPTGVHDMVVLVLRFVQEIDESERPLHGSLRTQATEH